MRREETLTADEFIAMAENEEPGDYKEMAEIVINMSYAPCIYNMVNWFAYVSAKLMSICANDPKEYKLNEDRLPTLVDTNMAFNHDALVRCMLDTMVQRAGGIVNWDTGDAGWGQLYHITYGNKAEPCPGGIGYMIGFREFLKEERKEEMIQASAKPELYADEPYDGGGGGLDVGPCFIEEVSHEDDKRNG